MKNILIFAPHPDDEVLGCGGTICKYKDMGYKIAVCIVTKGYEPFFDQNLVLTGRDEAKKASSLLGVDELIFLDFPSTQIENVSRIELNSRLLEIVESKKPDIVYIPHFGDMQKDHAIIAENLMVVLRPIYSWKVKEVYSYETLSETEWNIPHNKNAFIPNVFVDISTYLEQKINAMKCYESQLKAFPHPRSIEGIYHLSRLRGSTILVNSAEAFMLIRMMS